MNTLLKITSQVGISLGCWLTPLQSIDTAGLLCIFQVQEWDLDIEGAYSDLWRVWGRRMCTGLRIGLEGLSVYLGTTNE